MSQFVYTCVAKCSTLLICLSLFSTEQFEVQRKDGTSLIGYYDKPEQIPFAIALILPGSQKESARRMHDSLKTDLNNIDLCALTLEKKGIENEKEYIRSLSLQERLEDHLLVNEKLKKLIPEWNGKIAIIGQGDGGRIGAAFAAATQNSSALILIGSGGGWTPLEETLCAFRREMGANGYAPGHIQCFIVQAKQEFDQALKNPKPEHKAFGYTYKYWESLLKTSLIDNLVSLKCPIYAVHGSLDDRIPVESVDAMAKRLKNRVTYLRKEKAGREIIQDPKTYEEAFLWLQDQL